MLNPSFLLLYIYFRQNTHNILTKKKTPWILQRVFLRRIYRVKHDYDKNLIRSPADMLVRSKTGTSGSASTTALFASSSFE